jgi:hypothetical protein
MSLEQSFPPEVNNPADELIDDPDYLKTKNRIQALLVKRYLSRAENIDRPKFEVEIEWADTHSKKLREVFNGLFSTNKGALLEALSSPDTTDAFLADIESRIHVEEPLPV